MKRNFIYGLMIIVAINIGFYYVLILPQKVKADNLFKEIEARRTEAVAFKFASTSSFAEIKADIEKFKNMLPRKTEMTNIIREIDGLARSASLSIHAISYESGKGERKGEKNAISEVSFSFPVEGKYGDIKNFIYKLESSKRLITIDDLGLEKASGKEDIRLKIRMSVYLKNE